MPYSPVMFDLAGTELTAEEKEILQHPMIGGLIFFSRNYYNIEQITHLIKTVRDGAKQEILIAIDHEGGRVQRFHEGFTSLPAVAELGKAYDKSQAHGLQLAQQHGWLMAAELKSVGIDFSFTPVLDLDHGISDFMGDRIFHQDPDVLVKLGAAYIKGMHEAGMAATGKHFPGHGAVKADSHIDLPIDHRTKAAIFEKDILPFSQLFLQGLDAVMPSHVIYPNIDDKPAGFSRIWLQDILRQQLKFDGVIFSDDLGMKAASFAGGYTERAEAALEAGCDMILPCNNRKSIIEILDNVKIKPSAASAQRLDRMKGSALFNRSALLDSEHWEQAANNMSLFT
ncbi:MAG: beta-N-acetylhexosaminidase [Cocleimonas sp.]|nr:beta-N-acetylhexosaminidase [Cocleimonas sp.]